MSLNPWKWFYLETSNAILSLPSLTLSAQYTGEQMCMGTRAHTHEHTHLPGKICLCVSKIRMGGKVYILVFFKFIILQMLPMSDECDFVRGE